MIRCINSKPQFENPLKTGENVTNVKIKWDLNFFFILHNAIDSKWKSERIKVREKLFLKWYKSVINNLPTKQHTNDLKPSIFFKCILRWAWHLASFRIFVGFARCAQRTSHRIRADSIMSHYSKIFDENRLRNTHTYCVECVHSLYVEAGTLSAT